ncbi:MAG: zinc ribbon domain-containing protein [Candidatus Aenigmarchaeota archaeon]|nr:zinc ribbon domain-containing protein [Candidatus Aenigmarchaeota archaeon]
MILGIIFFVGTFYITQIMISPQEKQQVELANQICNFDIYGIPLGQIGQAISPEAAGKCEEIKTISMVITWGWLGYVMGLFLLVVGLVTGGRKEIIREIIREPVNYSKTEEKEYLDEEEDEELDDKENIKKIKYCASCGKKLSKGEKFCPKCGEKI